MKIQLITHDNGVGLSQDMALLRQILEPAGHEVFHTPHNDPGKPADLNIHIEILVANSFRSAPKNVLIPNPEWFLQIWDRSIKEITAIWCKTDHALNIFKGKGNAVKMGWTSRDMKGEGVGSLHNSCLHLAGLSTAKNTKEALQGYALSKGERMALISRKKGNALLNQAGKIHPDIVFMQAPSDHDLKAVMNTYKIHLCPSACEGWGHYIAEAMSTGAIVITTDAGPMNELIAKDRGILIECNAVGSQGWSQKWGVKPQDIANAIDHAIGMEEQQRATMSANAREWFLNNDREFRNRIVQLINELWK